eukprot:5883481-Lingulodinium_polyedra.AAC.1
MARSEPIRLTPSPRTLARKLSISNAMSAIMYAPGNPRGLPNDPMPGAHGIKNHGGQMLSLLGRRS